MDFKEGQISPIIGRSNEIYTRVLFWRTKRHKRRLVYRKMTQDFSSGGVCNQVIPVVLIMD